MKPIPMIPRRRRSVAALATCSLTLVLVAAASPAGAAGCAFESQGEGRVAAVIDARTFRLEDGREVRLAGIEPASLDKPRGAAALSAVLTGRDVILRAEDDAPDRYGRQTAFVFLATSESPVQALLLSRGEALVSATVTDKDCAAVLASAEATGRQTRLGTWATPAAIKNAESPGDILAEIGRFAVVEGKVLSASGWGDDLPEFRAKLDTGLCCEYFETRAAGLRGCRPARQVTGKPSGSRPWLG